MISLEISGVPVPQHRPRCTKNGHVYDDQKLIKEQYRWQLKGQYRNEPLTSPISLDITFHMPIPKGTSSIRKKEMINGMYYHIKRPDIDNLKKLVFDTMNGIIFKDDSQVAEVRARKIYSERPATIINVRSLNLKQEYENNL